MQITKIDNSIHDRNKFDCNEPALNNYLKQTSGQHDKKDLSRTYVLTSEQSPNQIKGFYSLSLCKVQLHELPESIAKKYPNELYCALISRLAVHKTLQRQGIGSLLLIDAIKESVTSNIPVPMIVIDAKNKIAFDIYKKFGFIEFPNNSNRLYMTTKNAKATLVEAGVLKDD